MMPLRKEERGCRYLLFATFISVVLLAVVLRVGDIKVIANFFYSLTLTLSGMTVVEWTKCTLKRETVKAVMLVALTTIIALTVIVCFVCEKIAGDYTIFMVCLIFQLLYGFWLVR